MGPQKCRDLLRLLHQFTSKRVEENAKGDNGNPALTAVCSETKKQTQRDKPEGTRQNDETGNRTDLVTGSNFRVL